MNPNNSLILVVDDETKIRRLISTNLAFEGFDVVQAEDGKRALEVFNHSLNKPDLILLDLMMPEMDGMAMLKQLRRYSDVPVIILSAKDERPTIIEGFREGADDFISKPFYIQELLERIRAVLRRSQRVKSVQKPAQEVLVSGNLSLNLSQRDCMVGDEHVKLTDREFRLLFELMKHPGEVLTHERLLRAVWGDEYIGEVQYLRVTFARIRGKLEQAGLTRDVIGAYSSVGYLLLEE